MANEKRLIDANAIYDAVERRYRVSSGIEHRCERDLLDLICSADTVDAMPVVHGHWEYGKWECGHWVKGNERCRCSVCHRDFAVDNQNIWHGCPQCLAKMDGGNEDG